MTMPAATFVSLVIALAHLVLGALITIAIAARLRLTPPRPRGDGFGGV